MRRGFTLIEVILALALLALLVTLLQGVYSGTARSRDLARRETGRAHLAAVVLQRLAEELAMCFRSRDRAEVTGLAVEADGEGSSTLSFTTRVPAIYGYSPGGEARVRYALEEGEEGVDLVRQESPAVEADIENAVVPYLIAAGLARFQVLCYDGEKWLEEWDSAQRPEEPFLPLAVSVELAWAGGDEEPERVYRTSTPVYGVGR